MFNLTNIFITIFHNVIFDFEKESYKHYQRLCAIFLKYLVLLQTVKTFLRWSKRLINLQKR